MLLELSAATPGYPVRAQVVLLALRNAKTWAADPVPMYPLSAATDICPSRHIGSAVFAAVDVVLGAGVEVVEGVVEEDVELARLADVEQATREAASSIRHKTVNRLVTMSW